MVNTALQEKIDPNRLPRHVAVIMDGNGRWAQNHSLPRIEGHWAGVKVVDRIVTLGRKLNLEALTLYSFSDENWNRPSTEINTLMKILDFYLKKELKRMKNENIRFNTIGHIEDLPNDIQKLIHHSIEDTRDNTGMTLTLALSYGGRQEIIDAVKNIAEQVRLGQIMPDEIDLSLFESYLSTYPIPDPDLIIRTSGERRISNFLLFQSAYTELHYNNVLWPDFSDDDFLNAIIDFQSRDRRFGMTQEQIVKA
ncbi:MAG: isoprenyl transferase [Nitrospinae bacterium]|nr:isoprenyl transferase [Nitrospinota bacterium]MZH40486.1 isoprenyl transferase [Nitrospinota bacterium]